jgi:hypothetical protein
LKKGKQLSKMVINISAESVFRQKKTLSNNIDRDKTKNKHYEQTLFLNSVSGRFCEEASFINSLEENISTEAI